MTRECQKMQFRHYFVSGRVQMVGFRDFTQKCATDLGLTGWVRNLRDGRVEILASGTESALDEFEDLVRRGPPHAQVHKFEKRAVETTERHSEFRVSATQERPWAEHS
jgi:acylphosphatase